MFLKRSLSEPHGNLVGGSMQGYVFGDWCSHRVFLKLAAVEWFAAQATAVHERLSEVSSSVSFQDAAGSGV